jgi:uncharacterized membrane protein YoaK (UPF0700 family)
VRLVVLAPALATVAGFVDAVGFITLHGLFVAHMSGNSVKFGVRAGQGAIGAAAPAGIAVALFVVGVAVGTVAAELAARASIRSLASVVLTLQAALITAFMLYGRTVITDGVVHDHSLSGFYVLAALGVLSMGMQTSALRQLGGQTVRTTYVTGVLTSLTQEATNYAFWLHDGDRRDESRSFVSRVLTLGSRRDSRDRVLLLGGIWLAYTAGGVLGSFVDGRIRLWALAIPLALLALVIAADLRRPIS